MKKRTTYWIPIELLEKMEKYTSETRRKKTSIIEEALEEYFKKRGV